MFAFWLSAADAPSSRDAAVCRDCAECGDTIRRELLSRHGTARHDIAQRCSCRAVPHESCCLAHSTVTHETALWTSSACCATVAIVKSDSATPHRTAARWRLQWRRTVERNSAMQCNAIQCNATEEMWSAEIHPFVQSSVQVTGRCSAAAHYAVGRPCEDWPHSGSRE